MIIVGDTLVSDELFNVHFSCNINICKGQCCIEGDAGAPLADEETSILQQIFPIIKNYLPYKSLESIAKQGTFVKDFEGELTTPLVDNKQCAYVVYEKKIAMCGIEKAYFDKKISFRKPVSCHLYPIRITKNANYDAVNYHKWDVCNHALKQGEKENKRVYEYAKEALVRKYGIKWYKELSEIAKNLIDK